MSTSQEKKLGPQLVLLSETFHRQLACNQSPIIHAIMTLPRVPDTDALNNLISTAVTTYPLFGSTISTNHGCKGKMYWEVPEDPSTIDVSKHIQRVKLDVPEWVCGRDADEIDDSNNNALDKALRGYVSEHISDGFDLTRGAFELHVVEYDGVNKKVDEDTTDDDTGEEDNSVKRCDLVWRIHHGIGDGVMLSRVLESLCEKQEETDVTAAATSAKRKPKKKTSPVVLVARAIANTTMTLLLPFSCSDKNTVLKAPLDPTKVGNVKHYGSSGIWKVSNEERSDLWRSDEEERSDGY